VTPFGCRRKSISRNSRSWSLIVSDGLLLELQTYRVVSPRHGHSEKCQVSVPPSSRLDMSLAREMDKRELVVAFSFRIISGSKRSTTTFSRVGRAVFFSCPLAFDFSSRFVCLLETSAPVRYSYRSSRVLCRCLFSNRWDSTSIGGCLLAIVELDDLNLLRDCLKRSPLLCWRLLW
jgi:hypothetical protein